MYQNIFDNILNIGLSENYNLNFCMTRQIIGKMPAGGALFGSSATGPGSTGGNKHLIEVRAGKMNLKGKT